MSDITEEHFSLTQLLYSQTQAKYDSAIYRRESLSDYLEERYTFYKELEAIRYSKNYGKSMEEDTHNAYKKYIKIKSKLEKLDTHISELLNTLNVTQQIYEQAKDIYELVV